MDLLPFNLAGKEGFVKFFEKNVGATPPTPSALTRGALIDMYKAVKHNVTECLVPVKTAAIMFDGWTDKYKKLSYMGVKCAIIDSEWNRKTFTLSCSPLENHTAEKTADFIKEVIEDMFQKKYRQLKLHSVHDGASNMTKTSRLLGCTDPQHCLAHVVNLILVTDGLAKIPEIQDLLEKCRKIVTCRSFKSAELLNESLRMNEDVNVYNNLRHLAEINEIDNLDEQFPANLDEVSFNDDEIDDSFVDVNKKQHKSLKLQIITRWNRVLFMTESISQLSDPVENLLKKIGKRELCLDDVELQLLHQLVKFLKPFEALTNVVSGGNSLSILPLIKHKITKLLEHCTDDLSIIKRLKTACSIKVETRFSISNTAKLACLLDPAIKGIFSEEDALRTLLRDVAHIMRTTSSTSTSSSCPTQTVLGGCGKYN